MIFDDFPINVCVRRNCRKLILRHKPGDTHFELSVPPYVKKADVIAFLEKNRTWMTLELQQTAARWQPAYAAGERHYVLGRQVTLGMEGIPTGEAFQRWRIQQLVDLLNTLLPVWAKRMKVQTNRCTIRDTSRQWGSCSSKHNISISSRLSKYPPECVELVLVHELTHIHHPDHSDAFYSELAMMLPDWKARNDLLNHMKTDPERGTSTCV